MNLILFFYGKLFMIFLFFLFFHTVNSSFEDYPFYLSLSNDNIFIIHHEGIDIYDSSFNKIEQIIQFSGDEKLTEKSFEKIKIKYDNEIILSIINDYIYIFNNEGKFLYKSENKLNNNKGIDRCSLTSIGLFNDEYKYAIGYFKDSKYLYLFLYSYNIKTNENKELHSSIKTEYWSDSLESNKFYQTFKDLSCEYIKDYSNSSIITCFFYTRFSNADTFSLATTYYSISNDDKLILSYKPSIKLNYKNIFSYSPYFIKSETNYNRTLAFVWYHFATEKRTYFATFNITNNKMENLTWIDKCSYKIYKTQINKFPKNNGLALTYEFNETIIKADLYNNIDNINFNKSSFELNTSCENINGPAISYYNNNQNYYIYYCFKNCSDELYKNDTYCLNLLRKEEGSNVIIYIIIIVIILLFILIISILVYKRCTKKTEEELLAEKWKKSQKDERVMNDILTDLLPDNN